ncbi:hypothetical protein BJD99_10535 [Rhodococcus sp. 1163]|uniref:hypothetical protein n=1 Tax=Rhodococcus sp. 1163 TaxID=1905289 RepID=UPI0009FC57C1|nr:hypothetical protein [Rhodococcus sp. 1163]ORI16921.1 hypothetical protein BJD99_10535 [Rhodococcus sp. 1163]
MSSTDNAQGSGIESSGWDRGSRGFAGIGEREAQQIVGSTDADEHRRQVAETAEAAERERAAHERDRASGIGVGPSLDNPLGQRLTDGPLRGLALNAAAAGKVEHRLDEEHKHLLGLAAGQRDGELLGAAWEAATAKQAVPAIMVPALEFDRSTVPLTHPTARRAGLVERMREHWAFENREAVMAARKDIEEILGRETIEILESAVSAYRTLVDAIGETGNAEAVIADGRPEVLAAFQEWPRLVARWKDANCVRVWVVLAESNGFQERHPDRLFRTETQMLEREVWTSQFVGHEIDVDTPEAALAWYAERETGLSITAHAGVSL